MDSKCPPPSYEEANRLHPHIYPTVPAPASAPPPVQNVNMSYQSAAPVMPIQPTTVTVHHTALPGSCPVCRNTSWTGAYSCCAWLLAILCFPCGILCCLCMRKKKCTKCGFQVA